MYRLVLAHRCIASAAVAAVAAGRAYSEERLVQLPVDALDKLGGDVTEGGGALWGGLLERESGAREEAVCFQRDVHGRNVGGCARACSLRQYLYSCTSKACKPARVLLRWRTRPLSYTASSCAYVLVKQVNLRACCSAGARGPCRTQPSPSRAASTACRAPC